MRIIAGDFRARKLLGPATNLTRPVTDRVKQSIFDILTPLLPGAVVYDCFAGTGSMGLECLSRGAARVTFFETDGSAVARLRSNIQTLGVESRSTIIAADLFKHLQNSTSTAPATLSFLDPPYRFLRERAQDLQQLAIDLSRGHLATGATVAFRHDARDELALLPLHRYDVRTYGRITVEFLRMQ